jgi:uncharacterized protein YbbK (DUF523 family)
MMPGGPAAVSCGECREGPETAPMPPPRPVLGVSACLLGQRVRHDGGDKALGCLTDLAREADLLPVCPEVEIGLGVPREAIRMERAGDGVRLRGVCSRKDHAERMAAFAHARVRSLAGAGLDGFVLKARSPSCGRDGVPVHQPDGTVWGSAPGRFADVLLRLLPSLPVVEETDLLVEDARRAFLDAAREAARRRAAAT